MTTDLRVRWMVYRDMPEVLDIQYSCFGFPSGGAELVARYRRTDCVALVAERGDSVIGFVVYELHGNRLHLLDLAVHPAHRRTGVGRALLARLAGKLSPDRRTRLTADVRETALGAQLLLSACGWRATAVLRGHFTDSGEDAYAMTYRLPEPECGGVGAGLAREGRSW